MSEQWCVRCGFQNARVNGRVLKKSMEITKASSTFAPFGLTDWVSVCPSCDAYALRAEFSGPTPFYCADGVLRSIADLDLTSKSFSAMHLNFCGLKFSRAALDGAIEMSPYFDPSTEDVERLGSAMTGNSDQASILKFVESVCAWGGGQRVWANLVRHDPDGERLAENFSAWFRKIPLAQSDEEAIMPGIEIKGLGVSFASKHLRMLDPQRFAVLDLVLSDELGFALNPRGYSLFMRDLRAFKETIRFKASVAKLEAGIFFLARQRYRSK